MYIHKSIRNSVQNKFPFLEDIKMETKQKKTKTAVSVLVLAGLVVFALTAIGGNLEPSAPPGPTMKTLDEVEPRPA